MSSMHPPRIVIPQFNPDGTEVKTLEQAAALSGTSELALAFSLVTYGCKDRKMLAAAEEKVRRVRDSEYWGLPVGTPIVGGMKPKGKMPSVGHMTVQAPANARAPRALSNAATPKRSSRDYQRVFNAMSPREKNAFRNLTADQRWAFVASQRQGDGLTHAQRIKKVKGDVGAPQSRQTSTSLPSKITDNQRDSVLGKLPDNHYAAVDKLTDNQMIHYANLRLRGHEHSKALSEAKKPNTGEKNPRYMDLILDHGLTHSEAQSRVRTEKQAAVHPPQTEAGRKRVNDALAAIQQAVSTQKRNKRTVDHEDESHPDAPVAVNRDHPVARDPKVRAAVEKYGYGSAEHIAAARTMMEEHGIPKRQIDAMLDMVRGQLSDRPRGSHNSPGFQPERKPNVGPSAAEKIANAAKMYGTGSKQHREAIRRFGKQAEGDAAPKAPAAFKKGNEVVIVDPRTGRPGRAKVAAVYKDGRVRVTWDQTGESETFPGSVVKPIQRVNLDKPASTAVLNRQARDQADTKAKERIRDSGAQYVNKFNNLSQDERRQVLDRMREVENEPDTLKAVRHGFGIDAKIQQALDTDSNPDLKPSDLEADRRAREFQAHNARILKGYLEAPTQEEINPGDRFAFVRNGVFQREVTIKRYHRGGAWVADEGSGSTIHVNAEELRKIRGYRYLRGAKPSDLRKANEGKSLAVHVEELSGKKYIFSGKGPYNPVDMSVGRVVKCEKCGKRHKGECGHKSLPSTATCKKKGCNNPATCWVLWAEGMAVIPACDSHKEEFKREKEKDDDFVGFRPMGWHSKKKVDDLLLEIKERNVVDSAYWGLPVGTPITPGMKPKGRRSNSARTAVGRARTAAANQPKTPESTPRTTTRGTPAVRGGVPPVWNAARIKQKIEADKAERGVSQHTITQRDLAEFKKRGIPAPPKNWEVILVADDLDNAPGGRIMQGLAPDLAKDKKMNAKGWMKWQPRYHKAKVQERQQAKWASLDKMQKSFQTLDRKIAKSKDSDPTDAAIYFMRKTGMRPNTGHEKNESYDVVGVLNIRKEHIVSINGNKVKINFVPGKNKGNPIEVEFSDRALAQHVRNWIDGLDDGDMIFQNRGDRHGNGKAPKITNESMIARIRELSGDDTMEARKFRTQFATALALEAVNSYLQSHTPPKTKAEFQRVRKELAENARSKLGHNDVKMTLDNYISPVVWSPMMREDSWL